MTRPVCLQIYVSRELGERIRGAASASELDVSTWARSLLAAACQGDGQLLRNTTPIERIDRHGVFALVGIDALLAGHSDHGLRQRAHQAYARKCRELGLVSSTDEGDDA